MEDDWKAIEMVFSVECSHCGKELILYSTYHLKGSGDLFIDSVSTIADKPKLTCWERLKRRVFGCRT